MLTHTLSYTLRGILCPASVIIVHDVVGKPDTTLELRPQDVILVQEQDEVNRSENAKRADFSPKVIRILLFTVRVCPQALVLL